MLKDTMVLGMGTAVVELGKEMVATPVAAAARGTSRP